MTENAHDLSEQDLLEKQVRDAFAEHDYAGVVAAIHGRDLSNDFKGSILQEAVEARSLTVVRHMFERAKVELSPEQGMMLLLRASNLQAMDLAVYLTERNAGNGVIRSDSYAVVFAKFPEGQHVQLAETLHAKSSDPQAALDAALYVAATDKKFTALPRLFDLGADPQAVDGNKVMSALLMGAPKEALDDKDGYLSLLRRYFARLDEGGVMEDALLGLVASFAASGLQHPETVGLMLDHGADAWFSRRYAERQWQEKNFTPEAVTPQRFETARDNVTQRARHKFDTLFGPDFRIADLRQEIDESGDTGLVLAARARVLDRVLAQAQKEGPGSLAAGDLTRHSEKTGRSLLSQAIDRDDAQRILDPAYWLAADPNVAQHLQAHTNEAQREGLDLQAFSAALDRQRLKANAARYKLKPGLSG